MFSAHSKDTFQSTHIKTWTNIFSNIKKTCLLQSVWLQSLIVLSAYVGFKGFDNFSLYAVDVYGYDEMEAAMLITLGSWVRPIAALTIGILADRFDVVKMLSICFLILLLADLHFAFVTPDITLAWVLMLNAVLTCIAIFGLRGLYFAVFENTKVSYSMAGTAVGVVSVIGFLPDVFVLFVAGLFIEGSPGLAGHQHFFAFLAFFACIGLVSSMLLMRHVKRL